MVANKYGWSRVTRANIMSIQVHVLLYTTQEHEITLPQPIWDDAALFLQTLGLMRMLLGANEVHALYER